MDKRLEKARRLFVKGQWAAGNKIVRDLVREKNPAGHLWLAHNLRFGYGMRVNSKKAMAHYRKAAQLGDPIAQYELGMAYFDGDIVEEDPSRGWAWVFQSARQGYTEAEYRLGLFYAHGWAVKKNVLIAVDWLERAARKGHALALRELGRLHAGDTPVKDRRKAFSWFRKAVRAMARDARAGRTYRGSIASPQYELAFSYVEGDPLVGGRRDYKRAAVWASLLTRSRNDQERASGYFLLGQLYLKGWGRSRNIAKGKRLLQTAADEGSFEAAELLEDPRISQKEIEKKLVRKAKENFRGIVSKAVHVHD